MKNKLIKNVIYKFIIDILRLLLPVITMPYIYRIFNPDIMGKIEFTRSISGYFFIFSGFGVFTYGLREISRVRTNEKKRDKLFTELFLISTISSIILTCLYFFYVIFKFNNNILLRQMLFLNGIQLFSYIFYIDWINEAFEDYKFISQKTIIIKLCSIVCIFLFVKKTSDFYIYIFIINIFIFINNLISFIYIKKYIKLNFKNLEFRKYILPLIMICIMANATVLYTTLDRILLGFYGKNEAEVAYYSISQNVMLFLKTTLMAIVIVSVPRLSFYLGQNQKEKYEKMLNKIIRIIIILLFPVSIGLIILSKEIIFFFGGEKYLQSQTLLIIFGVRLIIVIIQGILTNEVIFINRKEKIVALISIICGIINFFMKIILIKINKFDAWTAIITTTMSEMLVLVLAYLYTKKYLGYNIEILKKCDLKYLLFSLIFFPVGYFFKIFNLNYMETIIVIFITCVIIYLILLYITQDKYLCEIIEKLNYKNRGLKERNGYEEKEK